MGDFENRDKTYKVVQALRPGCFAKQIDEGKLSVRLRSAESCFTRAILLPGCACNRRC
jgi:hypothetical protein